MSTLLVAEPEANFTERSRALSLQAHHGHDGHSHQVKLSENDMMSEEFSSFQIRNFVSTVRHRDFSKCWPFRHKILEKCLSVGMKPFLPPFEPPVRGCDGREEDHDTSISRLHQTSPRNARDELCEESNKQDCKTFDKADSPVFNEKSPSVGKEACDVIEVEFSDKGSVENCSKETLVLAKASMIERRLSQVAGSTALENSQDGSANDFGTRPSCIVPSDCVDRTDDDEKMEGGVSSHPETITNAEKELNLPLSTYVESEAGSVLMVTGPSFSDVNGSSPQKSQQHPKGKLKSLSNECTTGEEQASSHKSKSSKVGMTGKAHQDESQLLSERLNISDQVTASCIERDIVGLPTRSCRNAEDYTFTGLNLDILVPQVCPVCLNFTSTSNTALNAHIDHCLESVLPGEKGESRACRNRIKPRKMRSMADICATAPSRTLEDLERSSKLWALNDEASKEDSSCTPSWKSGLIRRQPRTSLHRGPAWKAKSNSDVDDAPQVLEVELQPQLEKSQKENLATKELKMLWTATRTCAADTEVELEQSCKDQQLFLEEPGGPSHVVSSIKLSLVRKKKKKQSANVIFSKEVGGHCPSDAEQADHLWSVPVNLLDFTPVDTSAEEEKRLQQKIRCAKGGGIEAETLEQQGTVNDFVSRSGKIIGKQCSSGSLLDLTDHKSPNEVLKKRKRTQIDNDWILDEVSAEDVALSVHSERPAKNRRAAPKIKSLLTVVANSRKDKGKDGFEAPASQKKLCPSQWQEKTNDKGTISAPSGFLSGYQELNSKRRNSATDEGCWEAHKHTRFRPSEQPSTPDNLDSNNLSEHAKSPKGSSISSGRALSEHDEMYHDRPRICSEEEMTPIISAEEFGNRDARGENIGSLMSTLSKLQAGVKDSSCALEKRNITNAKAITDSVLVKAPPPSSDLSGLDENGSSHCRSRFEYLRKAFLNAPSRKTCSINREEVLSNTSNAVYFPEQAGNSNLLASQILTACNSAVSVSPFSNMTSRENTGSCVPQLLSGGQKSFFSADATNFRSVDNIRTNQMAYESNAASNFPNSMTRDNQVSLANLSPLWSENSELSASTRGAKFLRNNGQSLTAAKSLRNSDNCTLKSSVKHTVQQACFLAGDSFERSGSNGNESSDNRKNVHMLENGSLFVANRMDKFQGHTNSTENLQRAVRAVNRTMGVESPHQSQQEYLGSRFLSSELGPVHLSSAPEDLQENGHNYNCDSNGHDRAPLPGISTERMQSSLLADLARTMAGKSMHAQEPSPPPSSCFIAEQPRASNTCFQCTPKNLNTAREYLNLMPLQGIGKPCHPPASNGTVQPQLLHTALQTMKGHTSTINSERVHRIGGNMDVSMKICNTLSSVSPYRVDPSNASMIGKRESLLGGELTSNLNNYGTVEYSGDQGVVQIFGSPVFKLMGQNVIVTNSSIKAIGMEGSCSQNGAQSFHPSNSIRHLGVLPETNNHYSHKLSQELFSSSRLEAWHGDACMQRSHSYLMDSLEINPHTLQNLPPPKSVHSKLLVYKEPSIPKPQMPVCISGERATISSSTREMIMKKPMMAHAVNKLPTEVFVDIPPSGGNSHSAAQSRGSGMVAQQNDRHFTANSCSLARNEPLVKNQPHTLQSTSVVYVGDTHKLDVSGGNSRYRSGTLADIVQSSERSNN